MVKKRSIAGKQINSPKIFKQKLANGLDGGTILDREHYTCRVISQGNFIGQEADCPSFDQVVFQEVQMNQTHFKKIEVLDSQFRQCNLANAEWAKANLFRVELLHCLLTGFQASEAQFQDILFQECQGNLAQFAFTRFKAIRFENCDLREASFLEAEFSDVVFENCDLRNADLSGTRLAGVDLRGSKIDGVRVAPQALKGVIIDPSQALTILQALDIKVASLDVELSGREG